MNRLEGLREVPDAAWTETPKRSARDSVRAPKAAASVFLPWRVLRAGLRDPGRALQMFRMACVYFEISVLARLLPLPRAFSLISPRTVAATADEAAAQRAVNALDTLLTARIPLIRPQCWRRAAVLHRFLALHGIDTAIVFGVTTEGTRTVEAHAWLERSGVPFAEGTQTAAYRRVFEFPVPTRSA